MIRVDGELTLGDALNAGVEASSGELVTKMDDDDYYSTEHLWDLVLALEYSGADLVGKGAESSICSGSTSRCAVSWATLSPTTRASRAGR